MRYMPAHYKREARETIFDVSTDRIVETQISSRITLS